jgi:hypothetical protein
MFILWLSYYLKPSVANFLENILYSPSCIASLILLIFVLLNSNCSADSSHILAATHSWRENFAERMHNGHHLHLPLVLLSKAACYGRAYSFCRSVQDLKLYVLL